jgi:hypothetical protein
MTENATVRGEELCRHRIADGRGLKVINTDHRRDKSAAIDEMIGQLCSLLPSAEQGLEWLTAIRAGKPRYIRDQLLMIRKAIEGVDPALIGKALDYCWQHQIVSAADFKAILARYQGQEAETHAETAKVVQLNPLSGKLPQQALMQPDKSAIEDYQDILKNRK